MCADAKSLLALFQSEYILCGKVIPLPHKIIIFNGRNATRQMSLAAELVGNKIFDPANKALT